MRKNIYFIVPFLYVLISIHAAYSYTRFPTYKIEVKGHTMHYLKVGDGSKILLLLHGYLANKEQWISFISELLKYQKIKKNYTIIAPDLAGYGQSIGYDPLVYRTSAQKGLSQTMMLYHFIKNLQLQSNDIDIAGNSMGGLIQVILTKQYASDHHRHLHICSLAFIGSPSGVELPGKAVSQAYARGFNLFLPKNEKQFNAEIKNLIYDWKPILSLISKTQKQSVINLYKNHYPTYSLIWEALNANPYIFYLDNIKNLASIKQPIAIFWGKNDKLYPVSGENILKHSFSNVVIANQVNHAGHLVQLEDPSIIKKVVKQYVSFFQTTTTKCRIRSS